MGLCPLRVPLGRRSASDLATVFRNVMEHLNFCPAAVIALPKSLASLDARCLAGIEPGTKLETDCLSRWPGDFALLNERVVGTSGQRVGVGCRALEDRYRSLPLLDTSALKFCFSPRGALLLL